MMEEMDSKHFIPNPIMMSVSSLLLINALAFTSYAAHSPHGAGKPEIHKSFRAELIEPGRTQASQLRAMLGRPVRVVKDSANHEYFFYDLGQGAAMDATVSIRRGVVEYVSYLCQESMSSIHKKFSSEPSVVKRIPASGPGYSKALSQILYEGAGRGFIYEPRTLKVKACVAWTPGRKFEQLGK